MFKQNTFQLSRPRKEENIIVGLASYFTLAFVLPSPISSEISISVCFAIFSVFEFSWNDFSIDSRAFWKDSARSWRAFLFASYLDDGVGIHARQREESLSGECRVGLIDSVERKLKIHRLKSWSESLKFIEFYQSFVADHAKVFDQRILSNGFVYFERFSKQCFTQVPADCINLSHEYAKILMEFKIIIDS